jgi:hypothetical protein
MAWLLVDAVESRLTGYERTLVFIELVCGEGYLVITRILTVLLSTGMVLPEARTHQRQISIGEPTTPGTKRYLPAAWTIGMLPYANPEHVPLGLIHFDTVVDERKLEFGTVGAEGRCGTITRVNRRPGR